MFGQIKQVQKKLEKIAADVNALGLDGINHQVDDVLVIFNDMNGRLEEEFEIRERIPTPIPFLRVSLRVKCLVWVSWKDELDWGLKILGVSLR